MIKARKIFWGIREIGLFRLSGLVLAKLYWKIFRYRFASCGSLVAALDARITGCRFVYIEKMSCGRGFRLDAISSYLDGGEFEPEIRIGRNVSFGDGCHIGANNFISIGNNVLCGSGVYISDHDHGVYSGSGRAHSLPSIPPVERSLTLGGRIVIEDNVFIGERAIVLKNVTIGHGAVVSAGAVVVKDVPANTIVCGNPAVVVRRFDFELSRYVHP